MNRCAMIVAMVLILFIAGFAGSEQPAKEKNQNKVPAAGIKSDADSKGVKTSASTQAKQEGISETYYASGALKSEIDCSHGADNKTVTEYNPNGTLQSITIFHNGKEVDQQKFDLGKIVGANNALHSPSESQNNSKRMYKWTDKAGNIRFTEREPDWSEIQPEEAQSKPRPAQNTGTAGDSKIDLKGIYASNGLQWSLDLFLEDINWNDAQTYVRGLKTGGFSDWRLPTRSELRSLYDPSINAVCKIDPIFQLNGNGFVVWTGEPEIGDPSFFWNFNFHSGEESVCHRRLGKFNRVLAVRTPR